MFVISLNIFALCFAHSVYKILNRILVGFNSISLILDKVKLFSESKKEKKEKNYNFGFRKIKSQRQKNDFLVVFKNNFDLTSFQ